MVRALSFSSTLTTQLCKGFLAAASLKTLFNSLSKGELVVTRRKTRGLARPWRARKKGCTRRYEDRVLGHSTTLRRALALILKKGLERLGHRLEMTFEG